MEEIEELDANAVTQETPITEAAAESEEISESPEIPPESPEAAEQEELDAEPAPEVIPEEENISKEAPETEEIAPDNAEPADEPAEQLTSDLYEPSPEIKSEDYDVPIDASPQVAEIESPEAPVDDSPAEELPESPEAESVPEDALDSGIPEPAGDLAADTPNVGDEVTENPVDASEPIEENATPELGESVEIPFGEITFGQDVPPEEPSVPELEPEIPTESDSIQTAAPELEPAESDWVPPDVTDTDIAPEAPLFPESEEAALTPEAIEVPEEGPADTEYVAPGDIADETVIVQPERVPELVPAAPAEPLSMMSAFAKDINKIPDDPPPNPEAVAEIPEYHLPPASPLTGVLSEPVKDESPLEPVITTRPPDAAEPLPESGVPEMAELGDSPLPDEHAEVKTETLSHNIEGFDNLSADQQKALMAYVKNKIEEGGAPAESALAAETAPVPDVAPDAPLPPVGSPVRVVKMAVSDLEKYSKFSDKK